MFREIKFLLSLWKTNIQAVMEYRTAFLSQMIGMMLNNGVYFIFWIIFFGRFKNLNGWQLSDMFLLFGVSAGAFGLVSFLFGNYDSLSDIIAKGRLDYYLSLPRPILLHAIASRSIASGLGDFTYGILSYIASGLLTWDGLGRFFFGTILAACAFLAFMIIVHSLSFWVGNASGFAAIAGNAILTFALYPVSLFEGYARFILFTLVPAAFMGAVPAAFIHHFSWTLLAELFLADFVLLSLALLVFRAGLRRYESGSAISTQI